MSRMKHLLRKLHIGNGHHNNRHSRRRNPDNNRPPSETETPRPSSSSSLSPPSADSSDRSVTESADANVRGRNPRDFNFFEEEFQVQLAMALSASDPRKDDESDQIKVAKQLSLACSPSTPDDQGLSEFLSLKYWNYNVVHYDEKVVDGFYDVFAITSGLVAQGELPLLLDLQAISILDNVEYEVVLVNHSIDSQLQHLGDKVYAISVQCRVMGQELSLNSLIKRIANLVVDRMGGPVSDAEEMMKRWRIRSNQLRGSLNSIVLPLGCIDIGLSRHRALLFKVLADWVNLPCMLVKGSLYTGTDEGAVNLIKFDDGSEYILDLMGAPGTLIPVEVPSNLVVDTVLEARVLSDRTAAINNMSLSFDKVVGLDGSIPDVPGPNFKGAAFTGTQAKQQDENAVAADLTVRSQHEFQKSVKSDLGLFEGLGSPVEVTLLGQENRVNDVSKYLISAAKNPEFAQKLHTVFLESGAAPPADLLLEMDQVVVCGKTLVNQIPPPGQEIVDCGASCSPENYKSNTEKSLHCFHVVQSLNSNDHSDSLRPASGGKVCPMLGEFAEWEIPWKDLQIGERIGIGSYGEVFRADWNGTEVAVKKFLVQDFTGHALTQFKCEAEMMIRLRHPNVVLFMGAVTRPPNLSILTEFLPRGSLYRLLHRSGTQIDEKIRIKMALDVVRGMNYLHTSHPTVVHRDLKSPNLLVDKNWVVKVCDFGLSRVKHHTFLSSNSTAGTPEWMAPEVLRNEPSNEKCDVYSFGVILWEMATLCVPWTGWNPMQVVGAVGFQNRHLEIPKEVDPMVAQMIRDCWENDPCLRPSFAQLMSRLKDLQRLTVQRD